ncbi:MAG: helix-hairpin-helix domain-containing protein, partial [Candidatus Cloacimonetes bacterium]|nr:helix-hairpin-helix domain-containing protein [Candidatus Cloacimonadota bacterium]
MRKIIYLLCGLLIVNVILFAQIQQIDLNQATFDEIKSLPITDKQAEDIYYYRTYIDFFNSVYDLREIENIDQVTFNKI